MTVVEGSLVGSKQRSDLSSFGQVLFTLMLTRNVRSASELARMLTECGYEVSRQTVTNYATGVSPVATPFVAAVARVFKLNKKERQQLAWEACYGE